MALAFSNQTIPIPPDTGPRSITGSVAFGSTVNQAAVALNGFFLQYNVDDRHIKLIEADTDVTQIVGNTVFFKVDCQDADKDTDTDSDSYSGNINVLVIADVG